MTLRSRLALRLVPVALAALVAACGGKTIADPAAGDDQNGATPPVSGPPSEGTTVTVPGVDAAACVDLEVTAADLPCAADQDCQLVLTGTACPGFIPDQLCESAAANRAGAARIAAALASVPQGHDAGFPPDFCDIVVGTARCIAGQCTDCDPFGRGPAGCNDDGGLNPTDAAVSPPVDTCPDPSTIESGGACASVGQSCTGNYQYCSSPNNTTSCTCEATGWACESHSCPEGPPTDCAIGGACVEGDGNGCMLYGEGPCNSNVILMCVNGTYRIGSWACDVTAPSCGWATFPRINVPGWSL